MNYKKIKIYYLSRIILTTFFLIASTYIWFHLKSFNIYNEVKNDKIFVSSNITFDSLKQVSDDSISNLNSYHFSIQNKDTESQSIKISIVPDLLQDNISNNYIKYVINDSEVHSLNMDGIIYIDNISKLEVKDINLKVWISDTYSGSLNYNGRVIVS